MTDLLTKFDSGELIGLLGLVCTAVCGMIGLAFAFFWQSQVTRREEMRVALKQDMLNRGMSAEEIRSVLEAGSVELAAVRGHHEVAARACGRPSTRT